MTDAKAMAAPALDLFFDPKPVAQAKETFQEEIGDTEYLPLLPPDQKPLLGLNRHLYGALRPPWANIFSRQARVQLVARAMRERLFEARGAIFRRPRPSASRSTYLDGSRLHRSRRGGRVPFEQPWLGEKPVEPFSRFQRPQDSENLSPGSRRSLPLSLSPWRTRRSASTERPVHLSK